MGRVVNRTLGLLVIGCGVVAVLLLLATRGVVSPRHEQSILEELRMPSRALQESQLLAVAPEVPIAQPQPVPLPQLQKESTSESTLGKCGGGKEEWVEGLPPLYIITPTYPRAEQIPELTRTAQTLMNVANVVWIVSEDAAAPTPQVLQYLNESSLQSVYLRARMPEKYQSVKNKPRGVANRLAGLQWIRDNAKDGVFYFADDDNTYDVRLFEEMRWTKGVSMFPVGLVTKLAVSTPIVKNGGVVGFYDGWIAKRKFPIDMAGFAVNVQYLLERPKATMPYKVGYEEDGFMISLGIKPKDIEPLALNCTKIWVWHTQTKKNDPAKDLPKNDSTRGTNLDKIRDLLWKGNPK